MPLARTTALAAVLTTLTVTAGCGGSAATSSAPSTTPAGFLDRYVSDGRVLRHDQGDDVVSEGQAYGLLLAEAAGRTGDVRAIWQWTKAHLRRPDGLLSFHASKDGHVLDPQSATDADVLAAWALLRYRGPDAARLHRDGQALAAAVLAHESVRLPAGTELLAAGPWATGAPATVNPSYLMPPVFRRLASATGDARWARLADASVDQLRLLTRDGDSLPPDWARVGDAGFTPEPSPAGDQPQPRYGLDAQRLPIWLALDCGDAAHRLAGRWWPLLSPPDRAGAIALSLDGQVLDSARNPLPLLAASASARASGHDGDATSLLDEARRQSRDTPTYYGDAWVELYPALRDELAGC